MSSSNGHKPKGTAKQRLQHSIDPIKGMEIEEVTTRKTLYYAIKVYRDAIDKALGQAAIPQFGGHRHMGLPLSLDEQEHHEKVNRYLGRRAA